MGLVPAHVLPFGYILWPIMYVSVWRYMMARGAPYTAEEDAILLSTPNTAEIQNTLAAAGFSRRTTNAIKQRRNELRKQDGRGLRTQQRPGEDSMTAVAAAYDTAEAHVARLEAELAEARVAAIAARNALRNRLDRKEDEP